MSPRDEQTAADTQGLPEPGGDTHDAASTRRGRIARVVDAVEACLWIGLLVFGIALTLAMLRESSGERSPAGHQAAPKGLIGVESLPVAARSRNFTFWLQPTTGFTGGHWANDDHMFAFGTQRDDWIDLELRAIEPGSYHLELFLTKAADYAIVAVSLDGKRLGEPIDLWSAQGVMPTGPIDLGVVRLGQGRRLLRIEIVGANPAAAPPYFQFGIDGIRLSRQ